METGLLIIRVVVGLLVAGHGAQKLFGWFSGPGLAGASAMFEGLGWRPGRRYAVLGGLVELLGGLCIAVGFATPVACGVVAAMMLNAIAAVHWPNGMWNSNGGYEYPMTIAAVAVGLAFTGAGEYSVDHAIGWSAYGDNAGVMALLVALAGAIVGAVGRRAVSHQHAHPAH